jgi:hypothetical protein
MTAGCQWGLNNKTIGNHPVLDKIIHIIHVHIIGMMKNISD